MGAEVDRRLERHFEELKAIRARVLVLEKTCDRLAYCLQRIVDSTSDLAVAEFARGCLREMVADLENPKP